MKRCIGKLAPKVAVTAERALQFGEQAECRARLGKFACGQAIYRDFGRAGAAADRVEVARIGDQGGVDQMGQVGTRQRVAKRRS